ncbi:hypothetical protein BV372_20675 [Nostoc sp. T09]|nr:hypothetical protein BV372_20675 [Nostoc sp. T09]
MMIFTFGQLGKCGVNLLHTLVCPLFWHKWVCKNIYVIAFALQPFGHPMAGVPVPLRGSKLRVASPAGEGYELNQSQTLAIATFRFPSGRFSTRGYANANATLAMTMYI